MQLMVTNHEIMKDLSPVTNFDAWILNDLTTVKGDLSIYLDQINSKLPVRP